MAVDVYIEERDRRQAARESARLSEIDGMLEELEGVLTASGANEAGADRRRFPRHEADLMAEYRRSDDPHQYFGRVHDISRGGLRFYTSERLREGEVLQAAVRALGEESVQAQVEAYLRVVRVTAHGNLYEIGGRFVAAGEAGFGRRERRRDARAAADFEIVYKLADAEDEGEVGRGRVRDISQTGLRFSLERALPAGALLAVRAAADVPGSVWAHLDGLVRVVRARRVGSRYEIGAEFLSY